MGDAPLPREVRNRQKKGLINASPPSYSAAAATTHSPPYTFSSSVVKDRLRDVAEKEKAQRNQAYHLSSSNGSPHEINRAPPPPVRAKCTAKSRNDGLFSDVMSSTK